MSKSKSEKSKPIKNEKGEIEDNKTIEDVASTIPKLMSLIIDLPYGTVLNREDGLFFNKVVEDIIGYSNEEINTVEEWVEYLHPDNSSEMRKVYEYNKDDNSEIGVIIDLVTKKGEKKNIRLKNKLTELGYIWGIVDETELLNTKRQTEEYTHLLGFSKIGVWEWSIEPDKLTWNDKMHEIYGFEEGEMVSSYDDYKDRLHPDDVDKMKDDLAYVINNPIEEFNNNFRIILNDGTIKHIRAVAKVYRDEDKKLVKLVGLNWDITKEIELEEVEKDLSERYKFILDSIKMGIWDWDIKTDKLLWNNTMSEILGYDISSNVSSYEDIINLLHPDDLDKMKDDLAYVIKTPGKEFKSTFRIILNDGTLKHIRSVSKTYRDEDGIATRMVGLNWDITKEIELEERYEFILNSIKMGVWDWDIKTDRMTWNNTMYKIYGFDINDKFSSMDYFNDVLHPDDAERVNSEIEHSINTPGEEFESTFRIILNDESIRYIRAVSKAYRDEDGIATRMVGLNWNITKEIVLAERYKFILNSINIGAWDWDTKTDMLVWNDTMYDVFGYDINNKITSYDGFKEFLHPDDVERVNSEIGHAINTPGKEFESTFRVLLNGEIIKYIRSVSKSYRNQDGIAYRMVGLSWDITKEIELEEERKELVEEKKELAERFDLILKSTEIGVWEWDIKKDKFTRNQVISELFGTDLGSDVSFEDSFKELKKRIHPEDKEFILSNMERLLKVEIDYDEGEFRIITPNGALKHTKYTTKTEKDNDGNITRMYGINLDISKLKEYELQLVEAKEIAELANKTKSSFLANMSHEIRTPMNAIMGLTHLILNTDLDTKQRDFLTKIQNSSNSLLRIINDILDFSKIEAGKIEIENIEFELDQVLESVTDIITYKAHEKGLEVIFSVEQDVPLNLIGDPFHLGQIFTNLCTNALKFTDKGEILIRIEKVSTDTEQLELKVTITDNGIGMKEEQVQNLFTPFSQGDSSTTRKYGGTGLGLSICKNLVELLGGRIWVESEYGKGSKFNFTFKTKKSEAASLSNRIPNIDLIGMRVLVCDDNESSRVVLTDILTNFTFEVTAVENGYDAIEEIKKSTLNPFGLVLMDWQMPGQDGIETTREIQNLHLEKTPIVIMVSAFAKEKVLEKAAEMKIDAFLIKPVTHSLLFDTIINLFQSEKRDYNFDSNNQTTEVVNTDIFNGKSVLIVEDNEINQLVASELLSQVGFIVDIANNGDEAIQKVRTNSYDIVLMDLQMPIKDGYEATTEIREILSVTELPIVAMTADATQEVRVKCLQIGMNDFVTKPINPEKLFSVLSKSLTPKSTPDTSQEVSSKTNLENKETSKLDFKKGIDGIDLEFGLSVVGGNEKLYIQLLEKFNQMYHNFFTEFISASDINKIKTVREMHTLKGVAGNIGAKKLYDIAEKYMGLLENDFIPNQDNMNDLKMELEKVLNSTSALVNNESENSSSTNNSKLFLEKKNELENLLLANDFNSLKIINEILKLSDHLKFEKEFKLIHKYVSEYEFEKALLELKET